MKGCENILVSPKTPILDVLGIIDKSSMQIAMVVDEYKNLLGTVTDGDIRRGILKGITLDRPIEDVMFTNPSVARLNESRDEILHTMKSKQLRHIPVVDESGHITGIELLEELIQEIERDNWVVLMAGGLGTHLRPLTNDCPKPLLKVGNKPLLETILESCRDYGFHKFYISVNYKAEMLKNYFEDGSRWGVEIRYVEEPKRMGTAGALGSLPEKPEQPILVVNGDLLTRVNFNQLLAFHLENKANATMCAREYEFQVPYGVVKIERDRLLGIEEKPRQSFFVSAGIYVLEPETLDVIPKNSYFDMPILFEKLMQQRQEIAVYLIKEYWLDVGRMDDFTRANGDYGVLFEG